MLNVSHLRTPASFGRAKGGIRSVGKAFQVLDALAASEEPSRLSSLSAATDLSPSLLRAYLLVLQDVGMVTQDGTSGLYDLGGGAIHLGMAALRRQDLMSLALPVMNRLGERVGDPVSLSIWGEAGPLVVHNVERARTFPYEVRIGSVAGASTTAAGRCFLAHLPPDRWKHLVAKERKQFSSAIPSPKALNAALESIRRTGLATRSSLIATREDIPPIQIHALAAPVFGQSGSITASIVIISQDPSFDLGAGGKPAASLIAATEQLSNQLGYVAASTTARRRSR